MPPTMGEASPTQNNCQFEDVKVRINDAFGHLRKEMKEIQRQDIDLLKQLMYIRHTILMLSRFGDRRSYSISALDPPPQVVMPQTDMSLPRRPSLTRVQSAPLERHLSEDTIIEEDETDDELAESFNSTASDSQISGSMGRPTPETDFIYALGPLPPVFQRLLESSSASAGTSQDHAGALNTEYKNQSLIKELTSGFKPVSEQLHSEKNLLKLVARRRMLHRQKSVDEQDYLPESVIHGKALIDTLKIFSSNSHSEVQV